MNDELVAQAAQALLSGKPVVVRTETLYGIIALANSEAGVEAVYAAKKRNLKKQCIVLVAQAEDTGAYGETIAQYSSPSQPPTSVVVPASGEPTWVLRGGNTIAYRVTRSAFLNQLIQQVGPVIAPSANPEGLPPARTIEEARAYFGDQVAVYIDGGEVPETVHASRVIAVHANGDIEELRAA